MTPTDGSSDKEIIPARMTLTRPRRIGDVLVANGVVTSAQIDLALARQKEISPPKQLGKILIEMNLATEGQIAEAVAESLGVPFTILTTHMVQPEALQRLPADFVEANNLLPLCFAENWLTIAVDQFTDVFLIEEIRRLSHCQVQVVAADPTNIRQTRSQVLHASAIDPLPLNPSDSDGLDDLLETIAIDDLKVVENNQAPNESDISIQAIDSPVIKLVNYIIQKAVECAASDIHIEPDDTQFHVRYRVDGDLVSTVSPSSKLLPAVVSRLKIMADMDISERRLPQDGGMSITIGNRQIDLRVSMMATKFGEKVVMRIVDREAAVQSLNRLGFETKMLSQFRMLLQESNGIILVTGPTGSGKTTTLYGALTELVNAKHNISTIEDPVERHLKGTNQFQVHPQVGFTFASALRSLLRQDPDIIMVGEIRDSETAKLATEAALTGHLVLSTLHTNDALTAIPRLINMGVERYLVAACLRGVLAQRLVPRLCPHCRRATKLSVDEQNMLRFLCGGRIDLEISYCGTGCNKCKHKGFISRIGIFELLILNEQLLAGVAQNETLNTLRSFAEQHGFATLFDDGISKARQGLLQISNVFETASRIDQIISLTKHEDKLAA